MTENAEQKSVRVSTVLPSHHIFLHVNTFHISFAFSLSTDDRAQSETNMRNINRSAPN